MGRDGRQSAAKALTLGRRMNSSSIIKGEKESIDVAL